MNAPNLGFQNAGFVDESVLFPLHLPSNLTTPHTSSSHSPCTRERVIYCTYLYAQTLRLLCIDPSSPRPLIDDEAGPSHRSPRARRVVHPHKPCTRGRNNVTYTRVGSHIIFIASGGSEDARSIIFCVPERRQYPYYVWRVRSIVGLLRSVIVRPSR